MVMTHLDILLGKKSILTSTSHHLQKSISEGLEIPNIQRGVLITKHSEYMFFYVRIKYKAEFFNFVIFLNTQKSPKNSSST